MAVIHVNDGRPGACQAVPTADVPPADRDAAIASGNPLAKHAGLSYVHAASAAPENVVLVWASAV